MESKIMTKRRYIPTDFDLEPAGKKNKINSNKDQLEIDSLIHALRESTISDNRALTAIIHQLSDTVNHLVATIDTMKNNEVNLTKQIAKLKDRNTQHEFTTTLLNKKYTELELEIINLKEDIQIISGSNNYPTSIKSSANWDSYIS